MAGNKTPSSSGRQLLMVTAKLASESSRGEREALWRKKIRLLLDLDNPSSALEAAEEFLAEFEGAPQAGLARADVLCRTGNWDLALSGFEEARDRMIAIGLVHGARKLDLGPLFRLSEALGNQAACLRLAEGPEPLAAVLRMRTWRRAGTSLEVPLQEADDPLTEGIAKLERAWAGEGVEDLPSMVEDWGRAEPEWRWRVLVEGIGLFRNSSISVAPWRKLQAELARSVVLDPRFGPERHWTSALFGRNGQAAQGRASGPSGRSSLAFRKPGAP